jgi:arginase family enzyme
MHFINVPISNYPNSGCDKSSEYIKSEYDHEIDKSKLQTKMTPENMELPTGLNDLYEYILEYKKDHINEKIITIGGDSSILGSTIPAMNEQFLNVKSTATQSSLYIIILDAEPNIHTLLTFNQQCINRMAVGSILGITEPFSKYKQLVDPHQIIYIGLRDIDDTELEILNTLGILHFTMKKVTSFGTKNLMKSIDDIIGNNPVHLSISLKAMDPTIAPSVTTKYDNGLQFGDLEIICNTLKTKLVSMDLVEFDASVGTSKDIKITGELCKKILMNVLDIKKKSLNIFNEDSEFLIYRPLEMKDTDTDIGWYIVRGMDIDDKKTLLLSLSNDNITSIEIDDDDYLITKTTVSEQQEKSYFTAKKMEDCVLFPSEKKNMIFDLIN